MSWDLIVFDFPDPETDPDTGKAIIPDWGEEGPPAFATGYEIRKKINQALPGFVWEGCCSTYGEYEGPAGSIGIHMDDTEEPVSNFMLFCHGNPAQQIVQLAQSTGWNIYDLTSGRWMHDIDDPEEGAKRHREFVQQVTMSASNRSKPTPAGSVLKNLFRKLLNRK